MRFLCNVYDVLNEMLTVAVGGNERERMIVACFAVSKSVAKRIALAVIFGVGNGAIERLNDIWCESDL